MVGVLVKALGQPEGKKLVGVEGGCPVSLRTQMTSQGHHLVIQGLRGLGIHVARGASEIGAVPTGHHPAQGTAERRQSPGRTGGDIAEQGSSTGELVQKRARGLAISVAAQVVSPQGVHANEEQVGRALAVG